MALPPPKVFRQDMPPPGGFARPAGFPLAGFRKRSPARGPAGIWIVAGVFTTMAYGWYRLVSRGEEGHYYDLSKWNERFERAYLLNAREYAAWERRQKEALDNERKLMAAVPGFEVNKPRFYTGYQRTPHWTDTVSHDMDRSNYA